MVKKIIFVLMIASCMAWGQRVDTAQRVQQGMMSGMASAGSQSAPARVQPTSAPAPAPITASTPRQENDDTPADGATTSRGSHKRDPFVSPIRSGPVAMASACTAGKRCLVIDQIVLRGVVRTATGMIAVVANSMNKAYFLRENDPVFNGYVIRITPDSVVFKENTRDAIGHQATREVVKKVNAPSA